MSADSAALVSAGDQVAILAKAPRRTVAAVEAAVVGALARTATVEAAPGPSAQVPAGEQRVAASPGGPDGTSPERTAARRRKGERRTERRTAARSGAATEKTADQQGARSQGGALWRRRGRQLTLRWSTLQRRVPCRRPRCLTAAGEQEMRRSKRTTSWRSGPALPPPPPPGWSARGSATCFLPVAGARLTLTARARTLYRPSLSPQGHRSSRPR